MNSLTDVDWNSIPAPTDDGAADHLCGTKMPDCALEATNGERIDLSENSSRTIVYAYPMTGRPDVALPDGWDTIPGARGCTPQSCAFRDHAAELKAQGVEHIFGLSTQTTAYQVEAVDRLHLPFPLLSDVGLELTNALRLPTFTVDGMTLLKRLTLVIEQRQIVKVFYPVFPPDTNARDVMDWMTNR